MWEEWAQNRNANLLPGEKPFSTNFCDLSMPEMDFWLSCFVLEVRKQKNGEPYPPNTLYQLVCGLQRQLRESRRAEIKLLDNPLLHCFKAGEMMRLYSTGDKKQAQPISIAEEECLWELGLLGDHSPDVLLHTLVYQIGLFFALRSSDTAHHRFSCMSHLGCVQTLYFIFFEAQTLQLT